MESYQQSDYPSSIQIGIARKNTNGLKYEEHPEGYFDKNGIHEGRASHKETRHEWVYPDKPQEGGSGSIVVAIIVVILVLIGGGVAYYIYKKK